MKTSLYTVTLVFAVVFMTACNKTKTYSKRLMKAGEWKVTELSVNGTNEAELPSWDINDCDIYDEPCLGDWENEEGGHSEFIWQFRDKGKTFEISRQAEEEEGHEHEHDHAEEEAAAQCYAFSGTYEVEEHKKDKMEFKSTSTLGHSGQTVVIKIEKK